MHSPIPKLRAFAALALLPALAACGDQAASATAKAERPVQIQRVAFQSEETSREFVGVVRARYETDLGFRVAGKIAARLFDVGDRVHAGDVIARLDPQDLKLQVESARAELAAATSNLAQAASDELRFARLRSRGYATVADYERKQAAKEEADGRHERAQRALDLASNQLTYSELRADADGVITGIFAEPGQVIAIGQAVGRLAQHGEIEAVVALPESWLGEARASRATVRLWSGPTHQFKARLRELSPQADTMTRTYAARFTIENPDETVALGMTATVTLSHANVGVATAKLPLAAILNRGTGPSVYVVGESGALELRPVTLASFNEGAAFITSGLRSGENVVALGVQKLDAGQKVRIIDER
jgi:RND family efflux transporter MFP subunit